MTGISSAGAIPISTNTGEPVARVAADATVADLAKAIVARGAGAIVVGADERPTAPVSQRDIDPAELRRRGPLGAHGHDQSLHGAVRHRHGR
ncbi:CBS domain-containing protein [Mycobacterium lacus]|uniref:CBS domain-containing protein n=1 Tax=Mycobacterium lacus TaxID=169765 RepID=UPI00111C8BA2|nr:CBS domain-containing protein [Mycobacterium lacus]MCV7121900.1 hypothetical protein [Mycobacterium lacus]